MSSQAQTSTQQIAYVPEVLYGVTPASPSFVSIAVVDFTLGTVSEQLRSQTRRPDRQTFYSRRGNSSTEGELIVELRADELDVFMEAALQGTWTAGDLGINNIARSFTFEESYLRDGVRNYRLFRGVIITSMSFEITTEDLIQVTFGLMGKEETSFTAVSADGTGYTVPPTTPPFFHADSVFKINTVAVPYLASLNFELDNNVSGNRALGTNGYRNITSGQVSVSGSGTALFEENTLATAYKDGTDVRFTWNLNSSEGNYVIDLFRAVITSHRITAETDAGVTEEFDIDYIAGVGGTIKITRS